MPGDAPWTGTVLVNTYGGGTDAGPDRDGDYRVRPDGTNEGYVYCHESTLSAAPITPEEAAAAWLREHGPTLAQVLVGPLHTNRARVALRDSLRGVLAALEG